MKYTPTHQGFVFEPITTPNKNIQSYFMKNDQSFYTKEEYKYPNYGYSEKSLVVLIDCNFVVIDGKKFEIDFFDNFELNLKKYNMPRIALDAFYDFLYQKIKKEGDFNDILQVVLIPSDFFGRSNLMSFVDIFLNYLNFKSIMILPISLSMSFCLNSNFSGYVYKNGFTFIDDFTQIDTFYYDKKSKIEFDDEDFAEEFCRIMDHDKLKYNCQECAQKEDSLENIETHISKEHGNGEYYFNNENHQSLIEDNESVKNRAFYLFTKDKANKILSNINYINEDDYYETACKGALIFINLDASKELWMTDYEWRSVRLRVLKEKILFMI